MHKLSLLTVSLLGITGAFISSAAFAMDSGQSTYCKPGLYVGMQLGQGNTGYDRSDLLADAHGNNIVYHYGYSGLTDEHVDRIGMAGRGFVGYQFNPYFALETGYTKFHKTDFSGIGNYSIQSNVAAVGATLPYYKYTGELTQNAFDLIAKATLPLAYGFGIYLGAGAAYVESSRHTDLEYHSPLGIADIATIDSADYQGVRPTYVTGIDYTVPNSPVSLGVFYNGIAGAGALQTTHNWGLTVAVKA